MPMVKGLKTKLNEIERAYTFPNNNIISLENVKELIVRPSGTHRLKTKDGIMHIIPTGWIHIQIKSPKSWVV